MHQRFARMVNKMIDSGRAYVFDGLLACRINIEQQNLVELLQASRKIFGKIACTRIKMWLKNAGNLTVAINRFYGTYQSAYLVGMMRIVVDVDYFAAAELLVEAPNDAFKTGQSASQFVLCDAGL